MMKTSLKKNILLSEEIQRIKELFGNNFKEIINEQAEIVLRRAFDIDLGMLNRTAQINKVRRYLTDIERQGSMFSKEGQSGMIYPYESIGFRTSNDFMRTIETVADPNLSNTQRAVEIERVIRQLEVKDVFKFETKVKTGAKEQLDLELRNPDSDFRTQLNDSVRDVLDENVQTALERNPNLTTEELTALTDITYEKIKIELTADLGDNANLFDEIPLEVKEQLRNNPDIAPEPVKEKLSDDIWTNITDTDFLRIKNVFAELRKLRLGVNVEANIRDTNRQLELLQRYDLSAGQKIRIFERLRQNISSVISGDIADLANFKDALKKVDASIDALDLPKETRDSMKKQLRKKMTLNWFGASVGEEIDWVSKTEQELDTAHYGGGKNTLSNLQTRFTGNVPGTKMSTDYLKDFGLNFAKRALNVAVVGQFRTFEEIGNDARTLRGGTRTRYFKTYLQMLLIKFIILPLVELFWNIPITYQSCARYKIKKQSAIDAIKDAGGDEVDKAELEKAMPIPEVCKEIEKGNWLQNALTVFKNEANSLPSQLNSLLTANGQDNWFGTDKSWAITVENAFDFLNPFSSKLDDLFRIGYDYNKYEEWNKQYDSELNKVLDQIDERLKTVKEEEEKIKNIILNPKQSAEKVRAKESIDMLLTRPNYVSVERQKSPEYDYVKDNMSFDVTNMKWYVPNPQNKDDKYYFDGDFNKTGYYIDFKGEKLFPQDWSEFLDQIEMELVSTGPVDNSGPRNVGESIKKIINKIIMEENNGKKFGEDNFKHWKETFTFKSEDKGNPGQFKEVKIKMEDVMDRISHYRKKYDEDDSFVRAVVDTHPDVVKIMYTKGLADINESATPRGLALVLRVIKESRGEMEIFSVARPSNGNWFLVKGDYTQSQLANMDLEKKEPKDKEEKKEVSGSEELKKKEQTAINLLKRNEKEGLNDLPTKVREKLREKMGKGWTTEPMPSFLNKIATESEINTIFNDKIEIYKLESNDETFDAIVDNSSQIFIKRGFCRSLYMANDKANLSEKQEKVIDHILDKCDRKFGGKLGVRNF